MNIIKIGFLVSLLSITLMIIACSQESAETISVVSTPQDAAFKTYEGEEYALQYPATWRIKEAEGIVSVISPANDEADTFADNINVMVLPAEEGATLEDYSNSAIAGLEGTMQGFSLETLEDTMLAGTAAKKLVYTERNLEEAIKYVQVFTLQNGNLYVLTFAGLEAEYPAYEEDMDAIMDSFTIT